MSCPYVCYCIKVMGTTKTYVGISNNPQRRLKQHNSGRGARYTRGKRDRGNWRPFFHVLGFPDCSRAMRFEMAMKRKRKGSWLQGRCKTLYHLLTNYPELTDGLRLTIKVASKRKFFCKLAGIEKKDLAKLKGDGIHFLFGCTFVA